VILIPAVPKGQQWFKTREAAELIGMSSGKLREACRERKVAHTTTLGGQYRLDRETVLRLRKELGIDD
jgi:excisionase family DNA binding protein